MRANHSKTGSFSLFRTSLPEMERNSNLGKKHFLYRRKEESPEMETSSEKTGENRAEAFIGTNLEHRRCSHGFPKKNFSVGYHCAHSTIKTFH